MIVEDRACNDQALADKCRPRLPARFNLLVYDCLKYGSFRINLNA